MRRSTPWMPAQAPVHLAAVGNRCPAAGSIKSATLPDLLPIHVAAEPSSASPTVGLHRPCLSSPRAPHRRSSSVVPASAMPEHRRSTMATSSWSKLVSILHRPVSSAARIRPPSRHPPLLLTNMVTGALLRAWHRARCRPPLSSRAAAPLLPLYQSRAPRPVSHRPSTAACPRLRRWQARCPRIHVSSLTVLMDARLHRSSTSSSAVADKTEATQEPPCPRPLGPYA
ncbi:uncharacterized protein LOC125512253 [Triticum urartu]|uniref:uncharacterized protein LOC125512253 n=1 Tax=Triticum urartu TaxID=4572 RepID=UPI002043C938|nr:uncharacterized protein LOC125512253 [Triticum urartu]